MPLLLADFIYTRDCKLNLRKNVDTTESLVRMLYNCDERSMQIIKATVRAALDSQPKE